MLTTLDYINKTREYLDYLERHIRNYSKAWDEFRAKCGDLGVLKNPASFGFIRDEVLTHDLSKLSTEEFRPYRVKFFPVNNLEKELKNVDEQFEEAWQHHLKNNEHHWQHWRNMVDVKSGDLYAEAHIVIVVLDWMAMGYEFGGTAEEYYRKIRKKIEAEINLPLWVRNYLEGIFQ